MERYSCYDYKQINIIIPVSEEQVNSVEELARLAGRAEGLVNKLNLEIKWVQNMDIH